MNKGQGQIKYIRFKQLKNRLKRVPGNVRREQDRSFILGNNGSIKNKAGGTIKKGDDILFGTIALVPKERFAGSYVNNKPGGVPLERMVQMKLHSATDQCSRWEQAPTVYHYNKKFSIQALRS